MAQIQHIEDGKYHRCFIFGCSFTQYKWTTWANIMQAHLRVPTFTFAQPGCCNTYIWLAFNKAVRDYNIGKKDLVLFAFTGFFRKSYLNEDWTHKGDYGMVMEFVDQEKQEIQKKYECYTDQFSKEMHETILQPQGKVLQEFNILETITDKLTMLGCDWDFYSIYDYEDMFEDDLCHEKDKFHFEKLAKTIKKPAMEPFMHMYNGHNKIMRVDIPNKDNKHSDNHPTPLEHYNWLVAVYGNIFSEKIYNAVIDTQKQWEDAFFKLEDIWSNEGPWYYVPHGLFKDNLHYGDGP